MITEEGLKSHLAALQAAATDSASATLHQWCERARSAVELAAHARTAPQFDEAELVLRSVAKAVAIVRGKVLATSPD